MKKIAVITSVFNGEKYILDTIKSIMQNDHSLFDYYILNNGSTDDTTQILNKFKNYKNIFITENIKVVPRTRALNLLVSKIRHKYDFFTNVDADDLLDKNWLTYAYNFMNKHNDVCVLSGQFILINSQNEKYKKSNIPIYPHILNQYFSYTFPVVHSGLIFRLNKIKNKRIYNEKLTFGQDWDLCINLAKKGLIVSIDKLSTYFRHHEESLTKNLSNQLQSTHDKLFNLKNGKKLANDLFSKIKNKNREASEIFAISYINLKKKNFFDSINYFFLGIITFPFSIILNNKILSIFNSNRIFTYRVKKCKI
jgi:glycosyltransferase involved in cell wall biosynthesis